MTCTICCKCSTNTHKRCRAPSATKTQPTPTRSQTHMSRIRAWHAARSLKTCGYLLLTWQEDCRPACCETSTPTTADGTIGGTSSYHCKINADTPNGIIVYAEHKKLQCILNNQHCTLFAIVRLIGFVRLLPFCVAFVARITVSKDAIITPTRLMDNKLLPRIPGLLN